MTDRALWDRVERWLAAERVELDDLEMAGSGRARTVRVVVDAEGGVDLDRIAALSEGLSRLLDAEADLAGPYQLEVTSPGLERKLRRPQHYVKSIGREVAVRVRNPDGTATVKGTLTWADGTGFEVEVEGAVHHLSYAEVESAKTVFRWETTPKPGKASKPGKAKR
jgi:ribosome maturation factor RimP